MEMRGGGAKLHKGKGSVHKKRLVPIPGVAVSVVDALICAVGTTRDGSIFTTDPDFRNYATFLPIRLHTPRKEFAFVAASAS